MIAAHFAWPVKTIGILLGIAVALVLVLGAALFGLGELGEVVVLKTVDPEGATHETRMWVIDAGGQMWIRAGDPSSRWLARLRTNADVELTRSSETRPFRAVPVETEETLARINGLMETKYGFVHRVNDVMLGYDDAVPIRLDPRP